MRCRFRPVFSFDEPFLWEMLYYAAHVDEEPDGSPEKAKSNPFLTKFVAHWGKTGDLGVIAYEVWGHCSCSERRGYECLSVQTRAVRTSRMERPNWPLLLSPRAQAKVLARDC
jgi:hypothetical protein